MRAGRLDRRVIIDRAIDTQNQETGAIDRSWEPRWIVWAEIKPLKGRERLTDGGILGELDTEITLRYQGPLASLGPKYRLRHQVGDTTVYYNIIDAPHILLEHREIKLACSSGLNEGQ